MHKRIISYHTESAIIQSASHCSLQDGPEWHNSSSHLAAPTDQPVGGRHLDTLTRLKRGESPDVKDGGEVAGEEGRQGHWPCGRGWVVEVFTPVWKLLSVENLEPLVEESFAETSHSLPPLQHVQQPPLLFLSPQASPSP